jgi:Wax ester synthase/diacylglycerol acyltransferase catalytic domain
VRHPPSNSAHVLCGLRTALSIEDVCHCDQTGSSLSWRWGRRNPRRYLGTGSTRIAKPDRRSRATRSCAVVDARAVFGVCELMLIPMSPTDSLFLLAESENCQMQVGGLALFSPPEGARASDVREMFAAAIARDKVAGVWRKRARRSVTSLGQWGWDTGGDVDLDYHVQYSAVPRPAGMAELWALVSWLHAAPLNRERPLWEMHLIEGLADGRYAVYIKMHHALADGVSAMGMLRAALSAHPGRRGGPALWEPVEPAPEPAAPDSRRGGLDRFGLRALATA